MQHVVRYLPRLLDHAGAFREEGRRKGKNDRLSEHVISDFKHATCYRCRRVIVWTVIAELCRHRVFERCIAEAALLVAVRFTLL